MDNVLLIWFDKNITSSSGWRLIKKEDWMKENTEYKESIDQFGTLPEYSWNELIKIADTYKNKMFDFDKYAWIQTLLVDECNILYNRYKNQHHEGYGYNSSIIIGITDNEYSGWPLALW